MWLVCLYMCLRTQVPCEGFLHVVSVFVHVSANSCSVRGVSLCGECVCTCICELMFCARGFFMWCVCLHMCLRTHVLCEGFLYVVSVFGHVSAKSCSVGGPSLCGECVCTCVCERMFCARGFFTW